MKIEFEADFAIHFSTSRGKDAPIMIFFQDLKRPDAKQELIGTIADGQTKTFGRNLIIKSLFGLSMPGDNYFAKVESDIFINSTRASRIGLCVSREGGKLIVSNKLSFNSYDIESINKEDPKNSIYLSFQGTEFEAADGSMDFGKSVYRKNEEPDPPLPES